MRLSRLEKNKKAIEEKEYRIKSSLHNLNNKFKPVNQRIVAKKIQDPTYEAANNRSTSDYQTIKKINSFSITKITTDVIDTHSKNINNSDSKPITNFKRVDIYNNYESNNEHIKSVFSNRNTNKKGQTKSTTADNCSNNSENDTSYIRINNGYNKERSNTSVNLALSVNDRNSQEYVINDKLHNLHSPLSQDKNKDYSQEYCEDNEEFNQEYNRIPIDYQTNNVTFSSTLNSNTSTDAPNSKLTIYEKLDKVMSNLNSEMENLKKCHIRTIDYSAFNNPIPEYEENNYSIDENEQGNEDNHSLGKSLSNIEQIYQTNENIVIDDENECCIREIKENNNECLLANKKNDSNVCMCCMCSSGEVTETFLGDQIFHIINDIYNCHIKNDKIEQTIVKYKKLVHGFCSIEDKKEIIFFLKLFYQKVVKALEVSTY